MMYKMIVCVAAWTDCVSGNAWFSDGPLEGVSCDSEVVQTANTAQLHSILSELADTTFFRLVRVDGEGACPLPALRPTLAPSESTCGAVVDSFTSFSSGSTMESAGSGLSSHGSLCSIEAEKSPQMIAEAVVTSISKEEAHAQLEFPRDNECMVEGTLQIRPDYWLDLCSGPVAKVEYVNLKLNPERNTGYNGAAVWEEIHKISDSLSTTYEGRILSKIVSGYHASVTTQIMASYFPPKGGSSEWSPNPKKFASNLAIPHPEWIKNMQFAFVIMARSMYKIRDFLYSYNYTTGNETADLETFHLMQHFLDSSVLSSCDQVFSAFNETTMFTSVSPEHIAPEFKKAFRKISKLMNCVSCSRCRLHATVAIHGIGTAIKILLTPDSNLVSGSLSRDDVVALVNTIHKFSESIELANDLMEAAMEPAQTTRPPTGSVNRELAFVASIKDKLTRRQMDGLVDGLVRHDPRVMTIAGHFSGWTFVRHSLIALGINVPDAIIVGGGLAGLVTAISVADRGGSVVLLEKQGSLGGNSAKASSGINYAENSKDREDFLRDTVASQNGHGEQELARILVDRSEESVSWLEKVTGVRLSSIGKLGGHTAARTHRPETGVVGAEIIAALMKKVRERFLSIKVVTRAKVTKILDTGGKIDGVEYIDELNNVVKIDARAVVLASGGFGFDSEGLVRSYRPDLVQFPTTLGSQTTGDGIRLAASVGAELVDMEYVQLHPTGFVDPKNREDKTKVLAAEILRGIGGVLLKQDGGGGRFVNELGTRKMVTEEMLKQGPRQVFWIVISDRSAELEDRLTSIYVSRGLLKRVESRKELEEMLGAGGMKSLKEYSDDSVPDKFGRTDRRGLPYDEECEFWLVGEVTPVVHYTMGGVKVDEKGRVVGARTKTALKGLFAVGEVAGGVHGENRLGGNSLLECTVFGRIIGHESIEIVDELIESHFPRCDCDTKVEGQRGAQLPRIGLNEVKEHRSVEDCWTMIQDQVYDLSNYAKEHPGGFAPIEESCGQDSTKRFLAAHSLSLLEDIGLEPIGISS